MTFVRIPLFLVVLLAAFSPTMAAAEISGANARIELHAEQPEWIAPGEIPSPNPAYMGFAEGGIYDLLAERTIKWHEGEYIHHFRFAYQIIDRSGLEQGARLGFEIDPTLTSIAIHDIRIHRDGRSIDKLQGLHFQTVRRERDLERGILDGRVTYFANMPDIQVNDIVEYSVSYKIRPHIGKDEFAYRTSTAWTVPISTWTFRLIWPKGKHIEIENGDSAAHYTSFEKADSIVHEWHLDDRAPVALENNVPSWHDRWRPIRMSTYPNWQAVSAQMAPFYRPDALPASEFSMRIEEIAKAFPEPEDRAVEALRLVQDAIRYVGIEIGRGAFVPRPAETVIERGFGDCKDKTLLLLSALRRLGVKAKPALVHLDRGKSLKRALPSPYEFDHVIVKATIGSEDYWLDPTLSHQGGKLRDIPFPNYGYALPVVDSPAVEIVPIPISNDAEKPEFRATETFFFLDNAAAGVNLYVESVYQKYEANYIRYRLSSRSRSRVATEYLNYYRNFYPGIKPIGDLEIFDNRQANIVIVKESYNIPIAENEDMMKSFPLFAGTLNNVIDKVDSVDRTSPFFVSFPVNKAHIVKLVNPPIDILHDDTIDVDNEVFEFRRNSESDAGYFKVEWFLRTKKNEATRSELAEYDSDYAIMKEELDLYADLATEDEIGSQSSSH